MSPARPTLCEIACPPEDSGNLTRAVVLCAEQIGLTLDVVTAERHSREAPTITFHLGVDDAGPGHAVLCFVCRLACLCPQAHIGTVVQAESAFRRDRSRCSA